MTVFLAIHTAVIEPGYKREDYNGGCCYLIMFPCCILRFGISSFFFFLQDNKFFYLPAKSNTGIQR